MIQKKIQLGPLASFFERRLRALVLLLAVVNSMGLRANDELSVLTTATLRPGSTGQVAIMLDNTTPYVAFQFDISLSEGLSIAQNGGKYGLSLTSRASTNHQLTTRITSNGSLRVAAYSMPNTPFSGQTGAVLLIDINVGENCGNEGIINLRNIRFTTTDIKELKFNDVTATLPIGYLLGDANDDDKVTIADAVAVVNYILTNGHPTGNFVLKAANVDSNSQITIADALGVVKIILSSTE